MMDSQTWRFLRWKNSYALIIGSQSDELIIVQNCIICILAKRKHGKQNYLLNLTEKGSIPLDMLHIDHFGSLPSTKKSYQYIFAVIDAFSKFTWLYATKSSTTEVLIRLKKQEAIFCNLLHIILDRGTAFTSNEFKKYCREENIEHCLITTGTPRANGQIEYLIELSYHY